MGSITFARGMEAWCIAFVTTIIATILNKYIMSGSPGFAYPVTFAALQSVLTAAVAAVVAARCEGPRTDECAGAERALPPWHATASFAALSAAAAALNNASLLLNSVAYHQGMCLAVLPLVALVEMAAGTKRFEMWHPLLYAFITVGLDLMIGAGWAASRAGLHVALAAFAAAAAQQFACARLQARWGASPAALLAAAAPLQAALLLAAGPAADAAWFGGWPHRYAWAPGAAAALLAACALAAQLGLSQYTAIKCLGPSTYQALSQLTTVPVLVAAAVCFQGALEMGERPLAGAALAAGAAAGLACYEKQEAARRDCDAAEPLLPLAK